MIEYVIKSALCLAILLAVYHLLLEKEKMHGFNRFYLLFSLGFGLIIPVVNLGLSLNPLHVAELHHVPESLQRSYNLPKNVLAGIQDPASDPAQYYSMMVITLYGIITLFLLTKFAFNLFHIFLTISKNARIKVAQGTIVLLDEKVIQHSFLGYAFLSKKEYMGGTIDKDIIRHEFTHVSQLHSLDILIVELLKVLFWFNPVFILYKKAIQLNHEFLADEAVIKENTDVTSYQHLLLQACGLRSVSLASNFNYSITKKRLKMMTKQTSKSRKMVLGLSLVPVTAALVFIFSDQALAQGSSAVSELKINLPTQSRISKDEFYKGSTIRFVNENSEDFKEEIKYEALSETDKKKLPSPLIPTNELIKLWKNTNYKVFVNFGPPLKSLDGLNATDYISYESYKSAKDNKTYITLLNRDFLEENKRLGGTFNWVHYGAVYLAPPPPVMVPAKN